MWSETINGREPSGAATRYMAVNGTPLGYLEQGSGPPIVALHGAMSDMRAWYAYAPLLSTENRFVAYTQRHFGPEDQPAAPGDFSREVHIADLIGFVDALDAGPVHLVTWSYGGDIATYAMLRRPDLFRSAVHYEPSVGALLDRIPGGADAHAAFTRGFEPVLGLMSRGEAERAAFLFVETVLGWTPGTAAREPEPFPGYIRDNARTLPAFLQLGPGADIADSELEALATPVLIVRGERAHAHFRLIADRLAALLPNADLVTMEEHGHDGPYWAPGRLSALIGRFHAGLESG